MASALKGSRIAAAKQSTAVTPKSAAPAENQAAKRGISCSRASASAVPLAPNPSSATEMIM
jgi:hypothetical protein